MTCCGQAQSVFFQQVAHSSQFRQGNTFAEKYLHDFQAIHLLLQREGFANRSTLLLMSSQGFLQQLVLKLRISMLRLGQSVLLTLYMRTNTALLLTYKLVVE